MSWTVSFTKKAAKKVKKMPSEIRDILDALVIDLQVSGPVRVDWPNYSPLGSGEHHCHLKHSWVACWTADETELKMEIYYAGSREDAPY